MTRVALAVLSSLFLATVANAATLRVTIVGDRHDERVAYVREAVAFWNGQLRAQHAATLFGPISFSDADVDEDELQRMSMAMNTAGIRLPASVRAIDTDVVIVLARGEFASFTMPAREHAPAFVAIRTAGVPPLSYKNVARNVIAHELGHVLGLEHNADATTLMCGRPASCRPDVFRSSTPHFFPLTAAEKRRLRGAAR
jgi:hypothetical protein